MPEIHILSELVLILAAIVIVIPLFKRINIPPLVGFLVTGIVIGPYGAKLIKQVEVVQILAEVGVVLLLFTIGLEFSLTRLKRIKTIVLIGGGLQVILTIATVTIAVFLLNFPLREAIFIGFLISLSSTAIVMKILSDRKETDTPNGKISLGILLFQDLCLVPMMLLLPFLSAGADTPWMESVIQLFVAFTGVIVIFITARYLMPKIIEILIKSKSREMFVIGVVFLSLGTALITSYAGLSLALGAFIAGLILSESEYSHEIVGAALPFRDALSSLFFISIGMLLNLNFVFNSLVPVIIIALIVLIIKLIIVTLVVIYLSFPVRTAIMVGFALAQVGEFSFILAIAGQVSGLIDERSYQMFLAASIFTMMLTPLFVKYSSNAAEALQRFIPTKIASKAIAKLIGKEIDIDTPVDRYKNHVIIVGYGLNGKNLVTVLKETGIPYIVVDVDGEAVKRAKALGENIVFGDATRQSMLEYLGITSARVMVIVIADPDSVRRTLKTAKSLNPNLHIIVRTRYITEIDDLYKLGADQVIPEEFETSIEIFTRVLRHYHLPRNIIAAQVDLIRREGYGMFRGMKLPEATMDQLTAILAAGTTDTFLVLNESPAHGKSLAEIDLRNTSGATVIAVVRDNTPITNPRSDFILDSGDVLVLLGTHAEIDKAFEVLSPYRMAEE